MSLRIRRLRLLVVTEQDNYGADIVFPDGLVLLRAENTSGKSTCLKAIVYALGLERMFGPANQPPLTPAMTSMIEDGDKELPILESQVFLEIANGGGETLTLQRQVVGSSDRDWRLVTLWDGSVLGDATLVGGKGYYVRDPGTATRESGLHTRLAEFIGWELPDVLKYDGTLVPLYMECVLPLLYVEQRHGWSSIQATSPRFLQIRDIEKKAIEFLLDLDACSRDVQRQQVEQEEGETKRSWESLHEECELLANSCNGSVRNLPNNPQTKWPLEVRPFIEISRDETSVSLKEALEADVKMLKKLEEEEIPTAQEAVSETEKKLSSAYRRLIDLEVLEREISEDIELETADLAALDKRLAALREDLKKNQDVERLRKYGTTDHLHLVTGRCPTCHQTISDALLDQQDQDTIMTIDENIEYIRNQVRTFEGMRGRISGSIRSRHRKLSAIENRGAAIRAEIRTLKRTLISDGRIPSIAAIRERILLEEEIEVLVGVAERFAGKLSGFEELSDRWKSLIARKRRLTAEVLTSSDQTKLSTLERRFLDLESLFGFKSFPTAKLSLSRANYRPTRDGFDLVYDVSASDNVRTICAYLLSLLEVARSSKTNHPGLLILDEPRQQNLQWSDLREVLMRVARAGEAAQQVIVATSDSEPEVREICRRTGAHFISFPGYILQRIP